jgi:hypothetical protein
MQNILALSRSEALSVGHSEQACTEVCLVRAAEYAMVNPLLHCKTDRQQGADAAVPVCLLQSSRARSARSSGRWTPAA